MNIEEIINQLDSYSRNPEAAGFAQIYEVLAKKYLENSIVTPELAAGLRRVIQKGAEIECVWALFAADMLWRSGYQSAADFSNLWNCAQFAGFDQRFTRLKLSTHLSLSQRIVVSEHQPGAAIQIWAANALRANGDLDAAEALYQTSVRRFPDQPFSRLRLSDLYFATNRIEQARNLLAPIQSQYPSALEMMFISPTEGRQNIFHQSLGQLPQTSAELIWLVAADPAYTRLYARRLLATAQDYDVANKVDFHFHQVVIGDTTAAEISELKKVCPEGVFTSRHISDFNRGKNWNKAFFSCERFFVLPEILKIYQKPVLVTDIDVECLRNPLELLGSMGAADIAFTRFRNATEAWELYPATALLVQPTASAIEFFENMSGLLLWNLRNHPKPWFIDQISLYRMMRETPHSVRAVILDEILADSGGDGSAAYLKILHASWQTAS